MNVEKIYEYILENFTLTGDARQLIHTNLEYCAFQGWIYDDNVDYLLCILESIGFDRSDIENIKDYL